MGSDSFDVTGKQESIWAILPQHEYVMTWNSFHFILSLLALCEGESIGQRWIPITNEL